MFRAVLRAFAPSHEAAALARRIGGHVAPPRGRMLIRAIKSRLTVVSGVYVDVAVGGASAQSHAIASFRRRGFEPRWRAIT